MIQNIGSAFVEANDKTDDKRTCGDSLHVFDNLHSKEEVLSSSFEVGSPQTIPSQLESVRNEAQSPTAQELTNSILTALRDPAKPILCFLNPQPRDHERVFSSIFLISFLLNSKKLSKYFFYILTFLKKISKKIFRLSFSSVDLFKTYFNLQLLPADSFF